MVALHRVHERKHRPGERKLSVLCGHEVRNVVALVVKMEVVRKAVVETEDSRAETFAMKVGALETFAFGMEVTGTWVRKSFVFEAVVLEILTFERFVFDIAVIEIELIVEAILERVLIARLMTGIKVAGTVMSEWSALMTGQLACFRRWKHCQKMVL